MKKKIVAEPIKGTCKREDAGADDEDLKFALAKSEKDRAENIMIADLMRNDLSKICKDHSIREDAICEVMTLPGVHHLVSRISGDLRSEITIAEIFTALFPSGSVTGAPKIAAMNAIAKTEGVGRGPYCGALGYIDDAGLADFSVGIRLAVAPNDERKIYLPVGGGVTRRSDPFNERAETMVKARSAFRAVVGDLARDE